MRKKILLLVVALSVGTAVLAAGAVTVAAQEDTSEIDLSVTQADDGSATVTVTDNDSAVENGTVAVETVDNDTYEGVGEYTTDENGTVELPAPEENTTVEVNATVDNETVSIETTLEATDADEEGNFGVAVSSFVDSLKNDTASDANETDVPMGHLVSQFVLENNPAADKIPDHAGPKGNETGQPDHAGPKDNETGQPDHAGPDNENETGQPDHAGPDDDESGPPEHAGQDGDDDETTDEETEEDEEDVDDDEEETEDDDGNGQGPPDNAGP